MLSGASSLGSLPDHHVQRWPQRMPGSTTAKRPRTGLTPRRRCRYLFRPTPQPTTGALLPGAWLGTHSGWASPVTSICPLVLPAPSALQGSLGSSGQTSPPLPLPLSPAAHSSRLSPSFSSSCCCCSGNTRCRRPSPLGVVTGGRGGLGLKQKGGEGRGQGGGAERDKGPELAFSGLLLETVRS